MRSSNLSTQPSSSFVANEVAESGLIDYVDFGPDGNSFLRNMGVSHSPTAIILAGLLLDRQVSYFQQNEKSSPDKLHVYTMCLKRLAATVYELGSGLIVERLRNEPWCLGYQMVDGNNDQKERTFRIAKPNQIYLNDHHPYFTSLQPLCPPDEPELIKLYERFGSRWLSESVQQTSAHKGKCLICLLQHSALLRH